LLLFAVICSKSAANADRHSRLPSGAFIAAFFAHAPEAPPLVQATNPLMGDAARAGGAALGEAVARTRARRKKRELSG
jgi:hypothetical protein